jgi:hypothetical protein
MFAGSDKDLDVCSFDEDEDLDTIDNLQSDAYDDLEQPKGNDDSEDEEFFFVNMDDKTAKDEVTDESIKDYTKTMETLRDNKATNQETVDSFKRAAKALKDFDADALQKELERGAKDKKVHSLTVLQHLKEVLEKNGWKNISFQPGAEAGSVILKNEKTETYIEMQFSREKGKVGADVKIRKN